MSTTSDRFCACRHPRSEHAYVVLDGPCGARSDGCQKFSANSDALDRLCDQCQTPLLFHGKTLAGQACDLHMAFVDLGRAIVGPRLWWRLKGFPLAENALVADEET